MVVATFRTEAKDITWKLVLVSITAKNKISRIDGLFIQAKNLQKTRKE